jgi:predicted dienelactone hydrolase
MLLLPFRPAPTLSALAALTAFAWLSGAEITPIGPGPFAAGSTNMEVTVAVPAKAPMFDYLNGKATANKVVYLTDILTHPESTLVLDIAVPARPKVFGRQAGTRIPLVLYVLYPTTTDNPRSDYKFPYSETGDNVFPHMQGAGEKPIFADAQAKYPLIVYSGGYNTHGLWHLSHLKKLATHGYIVVDIFHGDDRGASLGANMELRPIELRAALDFVLGHPDFGGVIDRDRIGASGASAGGHTILAAMGGIDPTGEHPPAADPRIKAGVGVVPFMGGVFGFWPFTVDNWLFGQDHAGLKSVRLPFLALYGSKDKNVPPEGVEDGVRAMSGPTIAVMLDGESHLLSKDAETDTYTWEVLFFDAWLRGDGRARQQIDLGTTVRGGVNDHKTIQHGPQ